MTFIEMRDLLNEHFIKMTKNTATLFEVDIDKNEMWNTYLQAFSPTANPLFRTRTEHDCSCCRGFIKDIGNVVAIHNGKMESIWDFEIHDEIYAPVIKAMSELIHSKPIRDVYLSRCQKIGCHHNFETLTAHRWDHFFLELENKFCIDNPEEKNTVLADYRDTKNVFLRSLTEISTDALDTVLELIAANSLYKGEEWKQTLQKFRTLKKEFDKLTSDEERDLFAWTESASAGPVIGRLRNHSIGTLLTNITSGMDLEQAVKTYETITAPTNYKRSKPIFTKKMLEDAKNKISSLGYMDSLPRRFATLDDITVNDILFTNKDAAKRIQGAASIFDELAKSAASGKKPQKFDRVESVTIDKFISDILPTATSLEVYVENKHAQNFVSLIAPENKTAKSMFKWGNGFTWAYTGNMTDSFKQLVKDFGGNISGVLRFSIKWNEDQQDSCDLDAHAITPCTEIYYSNKTDNTTGGKLDVDIINPNTDVQGDDKTAIENITWSDKSRMKPGEYKFLVNQYSGSVKNGFRAEIEFDGQIFSFDYPHSMRTKENVEVAVVTLDEKGNFSIKPSLPANTSNKTIWNVETNQFVPVTSMMFSPNHWSTAENKIGHRHVFFMLQNCINEENPSGIFNEFLVQELYEHRKVMEAIGGKMRVKDTNDQLSGLGFATDKRADVVVRVKGATERILKITF